MYRRKALLLFGAFLAVMLLLAQSASAAPEDKAISSKSTKTPVYIYKVQRGDNLWEIAERYHCKLQDLLKVNPQLTERPKTTVYPNEKITVPDKESMDGMEKQVLDLTNKERAKAGLAALKGDYTELNRAARIKSEDQASRQQMGHNSPTLGSPFDQMRDMGVTYRSAGENVGVGYSTASAIVSGWMASPGHKANILSKTFTHLGVGYAVGQDGKAYWTQMFVGK